MSSQDLKTPLLIASRDNGPSPNQNAESEPMSPIIKITQTTASGQSPFWASDKSWEDRKAEAQKYLTDNKDDPKLKLHLLAHELNYEEIEKLAQQEWKKIGYHLDKQHKYMIKDNEKWPIIRMNPSEGLFVFNMGPLGLAFGKIEQDKSISIGKPLNQLKLYIKQNELGLTPLIYAIWAEQDAKTLLKRTSGLFYYMEFEIDDLGHFINLNEVIQNELYQAYLHFDSIEAIKFIIK